jgi:hypothetical protein
MTLGDSSVVGVPWGAELGTALKTGWAGSAKWPVLRLAGPVGVGLVSAVGSCRTPRARVDLANTVVGAVLRTLRGAHAAGIMHCDVRPANIVLKDGAVYLVDWGLSRKERDNARSQGVAAYAAPGVFTNKSTYTARPAMDVCGALCTWIAIVHGGASVEVPWVTGSVDRHDWLTNHRHLVGVREVLDSAVVTQAVTVMKRDLYDFSVPNDVDVAAAAAAAAAAGAGAGVGAGAGGDLDD